MANVDDMPSNLPAAAERSDVCRAAGAGIRQPHATHPVARVPDEEDVVVDFGKLAKKAKGLADEHGDKISNAVGKATEAVDQRTGGERRDKLQKVAAAAERLDKTKAARPNEAPDIDVAGQPSTPPPNPSAVGAPNLLTPGVRAARLGPPGAGPRSLEPQPHPPVRVGRRRRRAGGARSGDQDPPVRMGSGPPQAAGRACVVNRSSVEELTGGNGPFVAGTFFDLATVGYRQAEYARSAEARAYARSPRDPRWWPKPRSPHRVVYRPADDAAFDGTVVVEWLNVSGGLDAAPVWLFTTVSWCAAVRRGWACQPSGRRQRRSSRARDAGVGAGRRSMRPATGGSTIPAIGSPTTCSRWWASWSNGTGTILEGLPVERVLAVGESQSAFRLTTYVDEARCTRRGTRRVSRPRAAGRERRSTTGPTRRPRGSGGVAPFRDDLRVPVLCVQAETDLVTLGYRAARQDDGERLVVWEIAGRLTPTCTRSPPASSTTASSRWSSSRRPGDPPASCSAPVATGP